jgi:hypothetical protein
MNIPLATTSQDTSTQNNLGCAYLDNGDLRRAVQFFRVAFLRVKVVAQECQQQQIIMATTGSHSSYVSNFLATTTCASRNTKYDMMENSFVHTQVFRMMVKTDHFSPDTLEDVRMRSSIVIFNLALVMHIQSTKDDRREQRYLVKAKSLYLYSFQILNEVMRNGSTGNALMDLLYMAGLNNLAQITLQLSSYHQEEERFNQILGQLVRFARTIKTTTYTDVQVSAIMTQHVRKFLSNAATARFLPQVSAAAA